MLLLGGHIFVSFLHVTLPLLDSLHKKKVRLQAQFLDYPIKTIRLDNAGEFTSQTSIDYCMSVGIEHPVAHTHTQMV